jgi:hypothetical protein
MTDKTRSVAATSFANEQLACAGERFSLGYHLFMSEPKSAYELAMEKLRKQDAESGTETQVLTDDQRAAIAEARSVYESRVAERRIMHRSAVVAIFDPAEREERETELRRDLERFASERDAKIKKIRESR